MAARGLDERTVPPEAEREESLGFEDEQMNKNKLYYQISRIIHKVDDEIPFKKSKVCDAIPTKTTSVRYDLILL